MYDLDSKEFVQNPYPAYERLRNQEPVYFCSRRNFFYISKYADVMALARDPRLSSQRVGSLTKSMKEADQGRLRTLVQNLSCWTLFLDPPRHTRIRRVITQALSPSVVNQFTVRIQSLSEKLLALVQDKQEMELIQDLAYPLPVMIIAEILGASSNDFGKFKKWSDDIASFLGERQTPEVIENAKCSVEELSDYFRSILQRQRQQTENQNNILGALLNLQKNEPEFTDEDLVANCILLLFAGHETTTHLIANGIFALLGNPEQLQMLLQEPERIEATIEEILRFESPVQRISRIVTEDMSLRGVRLAKDQKVFLLLGAANRDPEAFTSPEKFDIRRSPNRHFAFGHGIHMCPGATLGRLEAKIALQSFFRMKKKIRLKTETVNWSYNLGLRAMSECHLILEA